MKHERAPKKEEGHLPRSSNRWLRRVSTVELKQWRESWKVTPWSREDTEAVNKELRRRDKRRSKRV